MKRIEIEWTPSPNRFITWGSDISLYEVSNIPRPLSQSIRLTNGTSANLLASNASFHSVRCLAINPKPDSDLIMALGFPNGRISMFSFENISLPTRELIPRHSRQCNDIAWNPIDTHLIAAGLEKYRSDTSVLVWDLNRQTSSKAILKRSMGPYTDAFKPVAEFGVSESSHSLAWMDRILAVGMNMKYIKLIDSRDPNRLVNSTLTRAVLGICKQVQSDFHLASFYENHVCVWDTRNFDKPLSSLPHEKNVLKISWSPTKCSLLATLQKESVALSLHDIQRSFRIEEFTNDTTEPTVLERFISPGTKHHIVSFSWHHTHENRFLSVSQLGLISDYTVFDRITLNWASSLRIVWTYGCKTMKTVDDKPLDDISSKIKDRVIKGYGLHDELWRNGSLVDDESLTNTWHWLSLSSKLVQDGILRGCNTKHPGVVNIIKCDVLNSEVLNFNWSDLGFANCTGMARIYRHENRDRALHLCGWLFVHNTNELTKFVERLETESAVTRAAAVAVFNLNVKLAIDILARSSTRHGDMQHLGVVAMALAGYSDDKSSMWKQFCSSSQSNLSDPYLKGIFAFLTAENNHYDAVLNEHGITVDDRVAFACLYLSDSRLTYYLKKLMDRLVDDGNLDGLLLTGNSPDGIRLLQRYINRTGDLQSAVMISIRAFSASIRTESVSHWISNYRHLLDMWRMWEYRVKFDIMMRRLRPTEKPAPQVYITCNFCGKSISAYVNDNIQTSTSNTGGSGTGGGGSSGGGSGVGSGGGGGGGGSSGGGTSGSAGNAKSGSNGLVMSACPKCRKPLPRCAICLLHMGTIHNPPRIYLSDNIDTENHVDTELGNSAQDVLIMKKFAHWFSWCQSCRHGGHVSHLVKWFQEHSECPVSGCTCKCASLDARCKDLYS